MIDEKKRSLCLSIIQNLEATTSLKHLEQRDVSQLVAKISTNLEEIIKDTKEFGRFVRTEGQLETNFLKKMIITTMITRICFILLHL